MFPVCGVPEASTCSQYWRWSALELSNMPGLKRVVRRVLSVSSEADRFPRTWLRLQVVLPLELAQAFRGTPGTEKHNTWLKWAKKAGACDAFIYCCRGFI